MTASNIESAKNLPGNGVPARYVARNLGASVPTPYRGVPASAHP
jgi:hypothetical protein